MDAHLALLLEQFERRLRSQRAGNLELLAIPGREAADVRNVLTEFAGVAPDELVTWFSWQDGLTEQPYYQSQRMTLIGMWVPYSLDEALAYAREGPHWAGRPFDGMPWLPLFEGPLGAGQGRKMLIASWQDGPQVRIRQAWWGEPRLEEGPASLADLVFGWLEAFQAGMRWDDSIDNWSVAALQPPAASEWLGARML